VQVKDFLTESVVDHKSMDFLITLWTDTIHQRLFLLMLASYISLFFGSRFAYNIMCYELPALCWRRILIGLQHRLNRSHRRRKDRRVRGSMVIILLAFVVTLLSLPLTTATYTTQWGWVAEMILLAYLIPIRHSVFPYLEIARALRTKDKARAVRWLQPHTERDLEQVDGHTLIRIAIMSLSCSFSRYVVAPTCYYLLFGITGVLLCRLFSCVVDLFPISHTRYRSYAASAYFFDSILHILPTRLSLMLLGCAMWLTPSTSARSGWNVLMHDPSNDPTTGINTLPMRMVAYGFGFALGGTGHAGGVALRSAWIGTGKSRLELSDLYRVIVWYGITALLWLVLVTVCYALVHDVHMLQHPLMNQLPLHS
jgi:cobalamin biosynthesis protein CobD/CbiB